MLLRNSAILLLDRELYTVTVKHGNSNYDYLSTEAYLAGADVVVKNTNGLCIAKVVKCEAGLPDDISDVKYSYSWVVQRISTGEVEVLEAEIDSNISKLKKAKNRHLKQDLLSFLELD